MALKFVFLYRSICSFLHYLDLNIIVNMKFDVMVTDFIGLWQRQNKVGNIGILVLWRDHELCSRLRGLIRNVIGSGDPVSLFLGCQLGLNKKAFQ